MATLSKTDRQRWRLLSALPSVYAELMSRADEAGVCTVGYKALATALSVSRSSARRYLRALIETGCIELDATVIDGEPHRYILLNPPPEVPSVVDAL